MWSIKWEIKIKKAWTLKKHKKKSNRNFCNVKKKKATANINRLQTTTKWNEMK